MVGSAFGTSRSMVNTLVPVTEASASVRFWGVPMSVKADAGLSWTLNELAWVAAAAVASEP